MKLQFEFQDETITFEHYLQNGLKVVQGGKEIQYNTCLHSAKVEKVFRGMLRKNVAERVQNGEFETIGNMLYEEIEKLKDIVHIFEKAIKLCEALAIEKEKQLLTTENQ